MKKYQEGVKRWIRGLGIQHPQRLVKSYAMLVALAAILVVGNYAQYRQNRMLKIQLADANEVMAIKLGASINRGQEPEIEAMAIMEAQVKNKHAVLNAVTKMIRDHYHVDEGQALEIAYAHWDASVKYGIPIWIGLGVNSAETSFNCHQRSYNGSSYGCMQINKNENFHGKLTMNQLWNITSNIELGYRILSEDKQRYHSIGTALEKYYGSNDQNANYQYAQKVLGMASDLYKQSSVASMG